MRSHAILLALLVLAGLIVAPRATAKDVLLGKWKITLTPDDSNKKGEIQDTLNFTGGNFESETFKKQGFEATTYEEDTRGVQTIAFTVKPKSEKEGEMKWTGQAVASEISGELTWTKKDGSELKYTFKGTRAEK